MRSSSITLRQAPVATTSCSRRTRWWLQRAERRLACKIDKGTFVYAIDGDRMHGTLELTDGTRYRVIEVERSSGS